MWIHHGTAHFFGDISAAGGGRHLIIATLRAAVFILMLAAALFRIGGVYRESLEALPQCASSAQPFEIFVVDWTAPRAQTAVVSARITMHAQCPELEGALVRLSWYGAPDGAMLHDAHLLISAKLRLPWGNANPGTFDYQRWLRSKRFRAIGYIRDAEFLEISSNQHPAPLQKRLTPRGLVHGELLEAAVLGYRRGVSPAQWALFRRTGTIHLMVVSGLHVATLASFAYLLVGGVLRVMPVVAYRPQLSVHALSGMCTVGLAAGYAWFTGADPPVVRAALMVAAAMPVVVFGRNLPWWRTWLLTLCLTLIAQPQSAFSDGLYLSFGAVACLLGYFATRSRRPNFVAGLVLCQGVLFVGLAPALAFLTHAVPLTSTLANVVAVPLMTITIIPLAMFGYAIAAGGWTAMGSTVLQGADVGLAVLIEFLRLIDTFVHVKEGFTPVPIAIAACGVLCLLLPGTRVRALGLCAWVPLLNPVPLDVPMGEFRVQTLDVGQGSAVVVDTHSKRLVMDAGARFPSGFDLGDAVVLPVLATSGPLGLDALLISHFDNDHAGGVQRVLDRLGAVHLIAPGRGCRHGRSWVWDGVTFRLLSRQGAFTENDRSCTLLVHNGSAGAYLSGDIGTDVEITLLDELPSHVDFLLAPHHGSLSSSSIEFVNHLQPQHVVVSAGRDNRYGHPHDRIVRRYRKYGSALHVTGYVGMVTWYSHRPDCVETHRSGVRCRRSRR